MNLFLWVAVKRKFRNMEKFVVKKDSWHYRWLAYMYYLKNYDNYHDYIGDSKKDHFRYVQSCKRNNVDAEPEKEYSYLTFFEDKGYLPYEFCQYWRAVLLWPVVNIGTSLILIAAILFMMSLFTVGSAVFAGSMTVILAVVVGLILIITKMIDMIKDRKQTKSKDGFFKTMYKSQKSKICPLIEYEKGEKS
jgi:hypothetical protein